MAIPKDRCSQVTPKNLDTKLTERAQPRELRAGSLSLYWGTAPQEAFLGRSESLEIRARSLPAEKLKADELPTKLAAGIDAHSTTQAARSSWRQIIPQQKWPTNRPLLSATRPPKSTDGLLTKSAHQGQRGTLRLLPARTVLQDLTSCERELTAMIEIRPGALLP